MKEKPVFQESPNMTFPCKTLFHKQIYQMENKMIVKYYVLDDFYIKHIWMCVYVFKYKVTLKIIKFLK